MEAVELPALIGVHPRLTPFCDARSVSLTKPEVTPHPPAHGRRPLSAERLLSFLIAFHTEVTEKNCTEHTEKTSAFLCGLCESLCALRVKRP